MDYHAVVVTVDHDGASAPQVNVFFPPVAHLKSKDDKLIYIQIKQDNTYDSFPDTKHILRSGMQPGLLNFYLSPVVFSCGLKNLKNPSDVIGIQKSCLWFVNSGDTFCKCGWDGCDLFWQCEGIPANDH